MHMRYAGALLVIAGCGGFGFSMAAAYRREEHLLRQLRNALQYMYCELQFHMTPLPELSRKAGQASGGMIGNLFMKLAENLEIRQELDASACMSRVLETSDLPPRLRILLERMGTTLGHFDLEGQLRGLEEIRSLCSQEMASLSEGKEDRLRSYQTLGLCAGAALVILFI